MSSVVISGDTSGAVTLTVPAVAGTNTVTIPASTGTVMVSGNMPAFSAYQSSATTITATWTKILYGNEEFDTNNNFASSRFTPTVAGYYQITMNTEITASGLIVSAIYKNGAEYKRGSYSNPTAIVGGYVSCLVYLNGSTDYIEGWTYSTSTRTTDTASNATYIQGVMIRAA